MSKSSANHIDDKRVVSHPVNNGGGQHGVREDRFPLVEGEISRDDGTLALGSHGQMGEKQLAALAVERNIAKLVENHEVDVLEVLLNTEQVFLHFEFLEPVDEGRHAVELDGVTGVGGLDTQSDGEMSFAGARIAVLDDILTFGDEIKCREFHKSVSGIVRQSV